MELLLLVGKGMTLIFIYWKNQLFFAVGDRKCNQDFAVDTVK